MEIVEYFFGNFWHFLELAILLAIVFSGGIIRTVKTKFDNDDKEK